MTGRRDLRQTVVIVAATVLVEMAVVGLRGYRLGGNVVVRCQKGHLFTTIWVPELP